MIFLFATLLFWRPVDVFDKWLFTKINSQYTNALFDYIMPYLRNSAYWAPLYLFLFVFVTINFKAKGWWWCLLFICLIAITDIVSSRFFKYAFERLRPCNDPDFLINVRLLIRNCAGGYSFTSSHAANHFGMATFMFFTFRNVIRKWTVLVFLWAAFIGYAQIYVGVHYPADIFGGAVLGFVCGWLMAVLFNKRFGFINFDKQLAT